MHFKIVPKQDPVEIASLLAALFCLYFAIILQSWFGVLFVIAFIVWPVFVLARKNKVRWCQMCGNLMVESTVDSKNTTDHEVVYCCKACGITNRSGLFTEYKK